MPPTFVDTFAYIALLVRSDASHERVVAKFEESSDERFVTTDAIVVELLAYVASGGKRLRQAAVEFVQDLYADPRVTVVPQTRELFDAALSLYASRPDKGYSLTDCMSMVVCRDMRIEDVLTHDRHFAQEGLRALLR